MNAKKLLSNPLVLIGLAVLFYMYAWPMVKTKLGR